MRQPEVWKILGEQIHQDFVCVHGDMERGIKLLMAGLSKKELSDLDEYLDFLIDSGGENGEKFALWVSSGASIYPEPSDIQGFFVELLRVVRGAGGRVEIPNRKPAKK